MSSVCVSWPESVFFFYISGFVVIKVKRCSDMGGTETIEKKNKKHLENGIDLMSADGGSVYCDAKLQLAAVQLSMRIENE